MNEPEIRYALDPITGNIVDAMAAILPKKPYECLICGGQLSVNQGHIQVWHFRHVGNDQKAKDCDLYYSGHYIDIIREIRTSEVEKDEKNKKIRLILQKKPFVNSIELYGVLPTLSSVPSISSEISTRFLNNASLRSEGFVSEPNISSFRPSEAEARFKLDPFANEFKLDVRDNIGLKEISGQWEAEALRENDVFIGDDNSAELVRNKRTVSFGEYVWIIRGRNFLQPQGDVYNLGSLIIEKVELTKKTQDVIKEFGDKLRLDETPVIADVVLPLNISPSGKDLIDVVPSSKILIAVTPPISLNPQVEVMPVPIELGTEPVVLPFYGNGITRWFYVISPEVGSERIGIHWAGRHQIFVIRSVSNMSESIVTPIEPRYGISVSNGKFKGFFSIWDAKPIQLYRKSISKKSNELNIELVIPEGLHFGVDTKFKKGGRLDGFSRDEMTKDTFQEEFKVWLDEGVDEMRFDFGPLGSPKILISDSERIMITEEEVIARLLEFRPMPTKVNWQLIREIFEIPKGTVHKKIPFTISRVKKILEEVKRN